MTVSVVDTLEGFLREHKDLAADPLAAAAMALAVDIDAPDTSAANRASCSSVFQKVMADLRAMVPKERAVGKLDDLQKRRAKKLRAAGA